MKRFVGPAVLALALLLATAALLLNLLVLRGLLQARQAGLEALAETRAALAGVTSQTIEISIPLSYTFPIQADVPVEQDFIVPIQTTIPISTVARVPIEIPLFGQYQLPVPVRAEVPVSLQVMIPVSQTVTIETTVAIDTEVPVQLTADRLGLEGVLAQIDVALARLEQGLRGTAPPAKGSQP